MTYEEQSIRNQMVANAQAMFPEEKNISIAFEKYMATLPEEERLPLQINSKDVPRPVTMMDGYERILCETCGADMMFRVVPENEEGILTQLVCSNQDCDNVLDSEYSLQNWMEVLKKK